MSNKQVLSALFTLAASLPIFATDLSGPRAFTPITPCRVLSSTPITAGSTLAITIGGGCTSAIPTAVTSVAANFTVVPDGTAAGDLRLIPGTGTPTISIVNFGASTQAIANAVDVGVTSSKITVKNASATASLNVIVDVFGYFTDAQNSGTAGFQVGVSGTTSPAITGKTGSTTTGVGAIYGEDGSGPVNQSSGPAGSMGVIGNSQNGVGVMGQTCVSTSGTGVAAYQFVCNISPFGPNTYALLATRVSGSDYSFYGNGNAKVTGTLTVTGTKSFVEPHPTDATKEIRFVSLEGPESGVYFRGKGQIVNGFARIQVPESFRMVAAEDGMTVNLTPTGGLAVLGVVRTGLDELVVQGSKDVAFFYLVNGLRRAYKDFNPIGKNTDFVPIGMNDASFKSFPAEIQERLIRNGTYLPNGTVNLEKAKELGWDKEWAENPAATSQR
jgi:hypothetical protein